MTDTRYLITLRGIVQGVGMRPVIATLANRFPVAGFCGNNATEVFIEVQGNTDILNQFHTTLLQSLPPLARVTSHTITEIPTREAETGFRIVSSVPTQDSATVTSQPKTLIPPDVTICADCIADMTDPGNRRYRYPFTTCTNCGPRLSIIEALPYDRPRTTLKNFPLCPDCTKEYTDPHDRRYHAQPISCPQCGPTLWLSLGEPTADDSAPSPVPFQPVPGDFDSDGPKATGAGASAPTAAPRAATDATIAAAQRLLAAGKILGVRGIGGFHIMCDALNPQAVTALRARKHRPDKPFAVMVPDIETARRIARLTAAEEEILTSPARPVVVAAAQDSFLTHNPQIAPGLTEIGIMLPYSPLHLLLVDRPVVATSANISGEPMIFTNDLAHRQLLETGIVDGLLCHDREIHVPVEDSVVVSTTVARRGRGLAPVPVDVVETAKNPTVLAVGGELKNTFCLARGGFAHISSHIGDMGSYAAQQSFERAVAQQLSFQDTVPDVVVCDLHPDYATTNWAQRFCEAHDIPLMSMQHHHAHAVSLLAEHHRFSPGGSGVVGVIAALDGTGFGTDGTIWGGEIVQISEDASMQRLWHLPTFPLVGGDVAVLHPWRQAAGLCHRLGIDFQPPASVPKAHSRLVASQLDSGVGVVETSSVGRLFDAAASLMDFTHHVTYEAQAAMLVEQCARDVRLPADFTPVTGVAGVVEKLLRQDVPRPVRAREFHQDVAALIATELCAAARAAGTTTIGVTGGCALNRLLVADMSQLCAAEGYELLTHRVVPPTDGGLSLGQAVYGRLNFA